MKNRHQRRAEASIIRRIERGIERVEFMSETAAPSLLQSARIHVAQLWKRYAQVTNDASVL